VRGTDINAQLAQARELEAKLAEEYRAVQLLRASIAGEASARSECARELGKQARERINATSTSTTQTRPRARVKSSSQPRCCYGTCPLPRCPRRGTCTARRRRSSSKRPCNRPKARRLAYAIRAARGTTAVRQARKRPFMQAARLGSRRTRAKRRSRSGSLICADRLRTATLAMSSTHAERAMRKRGRQWTTTPGGADATIAARIARRRRSPQGPVCSAGRSARRASLALPLAHLDRQVHREDGPSSVAQQLPPGVPAGRRHH
jgi:hypothetical protein